MFTVVTNHAADIFVARHGSGVAATRDRAAIVASHAADIFPQSIHGRRIDSVANRGAFFIDTDNTADFAVAHDNAFVVKTHHRAGIHTGNAADVTQCIFGVSAPAPVGHTRTIHKCRRPQIQADRASDAVRTAGSSTDSTVSRDEILRLIPGNKFTFLIECFADRPVSGIDADQSARCHLLTASHNHVMSRGTVERSLVHSDETTGRTVEDIAVLSQGIVQAGHRNKIAQGRHIADDTIAFSSNGPGPDLALKVGGIDSEVVYCCGCCQLCKKTGIILILDSQAQNSISPSVKRAGKTVFCACSDSGKRFQSTGIDIVFQGKVIAKKFHRRVGVFRNIRLDSS